MQAQQHPNARVQKLDRTQRFSKQLSQGSGSFATKTNTNASTKSMIRLSENSLNSKSKTIAASRGGSIPKAAAKEAREFGREIINNGNNAMSAVTQQTGTIM